MFILPSCSPSAAISRRVLIWSSRSDDADDADAAPLGLVGTEQSGLSDGVAAPAGVPLRDCSLLAIGVISVPTSRIDTAAASDDTRSLFCWRCLLATDGGDDDAEASGATRPDTAAAAAAAFLEKIGLECTTCLPASHFSASFHFDGTCLKNVPPTTATAAGGGGGGLSSL
ncbi:Os12g0613650 [Oryza sativa Japonica Group]|uniref:Os12g0613650 protein n=1 Tax=Oryza sativa subsp. japonica TaxID=39947 RepID=A0A0P0YDP7_ORYSJ|nr:Os12g0613650 [Oryza sativa Japonica Group]